MGKFTRDQGRTRASAMHPARPASLLMMALLCGLPSLSATAASNAVDNDFVEYYIKPCELGPAALVQPPYNWTVQEIIDYNAICSTVFSGSFTGAEGYSSTSGIGAISAQTSSSEAVAKQQTDSIQDRLDELQDEEAPSGGWGLLLSAQTGETERSETSREQGYDSGLNSIIIGLDYRFDDRLVTGAAVGFTRDETEYDGNSGDLETESQSLMGYVTYLVGSGGYVNGYIGYAPLEYSNERNFTIDGEPGDNFGVSGTITGDYEGDQTLAGIATGYDWYSGIYSTGVFLNLDYSETQIDGYTEDGDTNFELVYPEQRSRSGTIMLGVNGSFVIDMGWASLIPNASIAAVHETQQDSRRFAARLVLIPEDNPDEFILETDDPDRDYGIATLGAVIATNSGTQYFVTYEQWFEHDFYDTWSLSAGALIEF